jgi:hypothetical protein
MANGSNFTRLAWAVRSGFDRADTAAPAAGESRVASYFSFEAVGTEQRQEKKDGNQRAKRAMPAS